jgi:hypothetical protein
MQYKNAIQEASSCQPDLVLLHVTRLACCAYIRCSDFRCPITQTFNASKRDLHGITVSLGQTSLIYPRSGTLSALTVASLLVNLKLVNLGGELGQDLVGLLVVLELSCDQVGKVA